MRFKEKEGALPPPPTISLPHSYRNVTLDSIIIFGKEKDYMKQSRIIYF